MSSAPNYLVDTNILLRFLVNDHAEHGAAVNRLIDSVKARKATLEVPFITIVETIHTLRSFYDRDRAAIGKEMLKILTAPGVKLSAPVWILDAIEEYRTRNVSFGDACIAAEARMGNLPVASFDQGLDSFPGVKRFEPK